MICAAVTVSGCTSKQRYQQIETEFYNQQIKFSARIEKPEGSGPFPAVVIVHGSQNHRKDYYNEYSHYFAENGIVALSYDDRGFADSGGNLWTSDFLDLATDLLAAVSYLKSLGYVDEQRIGFWADSHGGWIVLIADSLSQEIAFIVNKSGPAVTPLATVLFEKSKRLDSYDLPKVTHDKILDLYQKMIEYLAGNRSETLLSEIKLILSEISTTEYFQNDLEDYYKSLFLASNEIPATDQLEFAPSGRNYSFDPIPYLKRLNSPMLLQYGSADKLIPVSDCIRIIREINNPNIQLKVYQDADHGIRIHRQPGILFSPEFPENYLKSIVDFIKSTN